MNAPFKSTAQPATAASLTTYRPFIDGLRAISILAVVLYHVGVPGVPGGYVGVDVFFVISGFLIISQIIEGLDRRTFSFADFWARRALRILPPYLLVVAATLALAPLSLVAPTEFGELGREARDGALMIINHLFLSQQGYFDAAADSKPLLHLWSLAVEEQFYVVAPLAIAGLWYLPNWLGRPAMRWPLLGWSAFGLLIATLAGCVLLTSAVGQNWAFYLMPLRAWEFVAGGAIGFILPAARRIGKPALDALGIAGLAVIVGAAAFYTHDTPYPSWRALAPVLGAVAVILSGLADGRAPTARLLALRPMVAVGLVSYAWYLWHWPLLALARIRNFGERDMRTDAAMAVVSLALAAATHLLVERPIRDWRRDRGSFGWRPVWIGVGFSVVVAVGGFQAGHAYARHIRAVLTELYAPRAMPAAPYCDLFSATADDCMREAANRPTGLLIGDSQILEPVNAIAGLVNEAGSYPVVDAYPGCGAFLRNYIFPTVTACAEGRRHVYAELSRGRLQPRFAVLYALWQRYGAGSSVGEVDGDKPAADQDAAIIAGLVDTIEQLRSFGVRRILIIGPTPIFPRDVPACLMRADMSQLDRLQTCGVSRTAPDERARETAFQKLRKAVGTSTDVRLIDATDDFCNAERCLPLDGDQVLVKDHHHLGDSGLKWLIERHRADFDWALGSAS